MITKVCGYHFEEAFHFVSFFAHTAISQASGQSNDSEILTSVIKQVVFG